MAAAATACRWHHYGGDCPNDEAILYLGMVNIQLQMAVHHREKPQRKPLVAAAVPIGRWRQVNGMLLLTAEIEQIWNRAVVR